MSSTILTYRAEPYFKHPIKWGFTEYSIEFPPGTSFDTIMNTILEKKRTKNAYGFSLWAPGMDKVQPINICIKNKTDKDKRKNEDDDG